MSVETVGGARTAWVGEAMRAHKQCISTADGSMRDMTGHTGAVNALAANVCELM